MLKFSDILKFPGQYSRREPSIAKVNIQLAHVEDQEDKVVVGGLSTSQNGQYCPQIHINKKSTTEDLKSAVQFDKNVKILCSCPSFKFEFAGALMKINSLLEEQYFAYAILTHKPKHKNIYQIPSGCKHIIALARKIWTNKNLKNYGLISNIMLERQYMFASMQVSMENWNPRDPYQTSRMSRNEMQKKKKDLEKLKTMIK